MQAKQLSLSHTLTLSLGESESFKKKKKRVEEEGEEEKEITSTPSNRLALLSSRDSPQQPGGAALEPSSFEKEPLFLSLSLSLSLLSHPKKKGEEEEEEKLETKKQRTSYSESGFLAVFGRMVFVWRATKILFDSNKLL